MVVLKEMGLWHVEKIFNTDLLLKIKMYYTGTREVQIKMKFSSLNRLHCMFKDIYFAHRKVQRLTNQK